MRRKTITHHVLLRLRTLPIAQHLGLSAVALALQLHFLAAMHGLTSIRMWLDIVDLTCVANVTQGWGIGENVVSLWRKQFGDSEIVDVILLKTIIDK